jgi:hypothetical protein
MKVREHAKQQTRKSRDALYAHAQMAMLVRRAKLGAIAKQVVANMRGPSVYMRPHHYILNDDHSVTAVQVYNPDGTLNQPALLTWGKWFGEGDEKRRVAWTEFEDGSHVSTVFLGLDHSFIDGPPILFESMTFTGQTRKSQVLSGEYHEELDQRRYETWDQAVAGHEELVRERRQILDHLAKMKGGDDA